MTDDRQKLAKSDLSSQRRQISTANPTRGVHAARLNSMLEVQNQMSLETVQQFSRHVAGLIDQGKNINLDLSAPLNISADSDDYRSQVQFMHDGNQSMLQPKRGSSKHMGLSTFNARKSMSSKRNSALRIQNHTGVFEQNLVDITMASGDV